MVGPMAIAANSASSRDGCGGSVTPCTSATTSSSEKHTPYTSVTYGHTSSFCRRRRPSKRYSATVIAPNTASASPSSARAPPAPTANGGKPAPAERDGDAEDLGARGLLAEPDGRAERDDDRVHVHEHHAGGDGGHADRDDPAPEMHGEKCAGDERGEEIWAREPPVLLPCSGGDGNGCDHREGEAHAPHGDGEGVGVGEANERTGDRDAEDGREQRERDEAVGLA